ncbi:DUF3433 domain-containing protein [Aspergillus ibericus CBS 121593]|uniref:Uncharacterized protein n=1 Tax=Aspergillus ibericus CBS 121593 TaxID=1448316 RepID=A0A395GMW2_9EURO|nr:hypothetical protein BO80DRAFT_505503 [Aspergillus ibericus CBS 121593]RAK96298.1 hypothetical protein BO80DRAFT_505503 [Aspergillus ibericus CBS 121593]
MLCVCRGWSAADAKKGWLPPSLRRPYLLALSALLLLIALAVEILRQLSNRHNGLVQYQKVEDLSSSAWQAWGNAPTIVALVALIPWQGFAQEAFRLEPYFQLANPKGAPASVLFLDYNFDAGFLRPIRAARNRHWLVLGVSVMSLLIQDLAPSLLSGLVGLVSIQVLERRQVDTWPQLVDLDVQENWLAIEAAYRSTSQNPRGNLPRGHGNSTYATAPVAILADDSDGLSSLALDQPVYWSDMTCRNATVTAAASSTLFDVTTTEDPTRARGLSWNLSGLALAGTKSKSSCNISIALDTLIPFEDGSFQAHLTIKSETLLKSSVIALACQPVYRQAIANISLDSKSTLTTVDILPSTVRDLTDTEFSIHGFQNLMYSERAAAGLLMDHSLTNLSRPLVSSPVAVAGDTESLTLTQYQKQIADLWNNEFLDAINMFFDQHADAVRVDANHFTYALAIAVIHQTAVMVEVIMVLGFGLLLALGYIYPRRPSFLQGDPSSIAAQCGLVARLIGPETLHTLSHPSYHVAKTRALRKWAKGLWCKWTTVTGDRRLELCSMDGYPAKMCPLPAASRRHDRMPHFLTLPWFMIECVVLSGSVTALGLASRWIKIHTLESVTSTRFQISVICLIYGPTMLASMVCSLSNSLHRHFSVTEPWIWLRQGPISSKRLSVPSHAPMTALCMWLREGPRPSIAVLGLSVLCLLNLSLLVVSGGLFEPQLLTYFASPANLNTVYHTSIFLDQALRPDFQSYDRTIYPGTMSQSELPWTTSNMSFLPFTTGVLEGSIGVQSTATTRGFGTYLPSPSPLPRLPTPHRCRPTPNPIRLARHLRLPETQLLGFRLTLPRQHLHSSLLQPAPHHRILRGPVSPTGQILKHTSIPSDFPVTTDSLYQNLSTALETFNQNLGTFIHNLTVHPHPLPYYLSSFPNDQTTTLYQTARQGHTNSTVQDLTHATQSLYQRTFANYLTLHRPQLFPEGPPVPIPGTTVYTMWGLGPSTTAIVIIIAVVSVDILGLVAVFWCYYNRYDAPRIPKAIGSLVPWVGGTGLTLEGDGDQQYHFHPGVAADGERIWVLEVDTGMELGRIDSTINNTI